MKYDISKIVSGKNFFVDGISYIGSPRSNSAMYITRKVAHLLMALEGVKECLVFAENGVVVPDKLRDKHAFFFTENPQLEYSHFARTLERERFLEEKKIKFKLTEEGYYISEDSQIGDAAYIEIGCIIGPVVRIGSNAHIRSGTIIKHTTIGNDFLCNEHAVIGANGFTMAKDEHGNNCRIPTLGRVMIGNHVEIGVHNNISCGSSGDTIIEDYTKLDALVHIGHDVHIKKNVEITAGSIIGGFDVLGESAYVGLNSALRNRITIGDNTIIGMGSVVLRNVDNTVTVAGNPSRVLERK